MEILLTILLQIGGVALGVALDKGYDRYREKRKNKQDTHSNAGEANEKKS